VTLSRLEGPLGARVRKFYSLELDRAQVLKFADMFLRTEGGLVGIDMRKIHDLERA
jgi:hypothetical protein